MNESVAQKLANAGCIFWDFDGVIKDSLDVKSDAFEKLFLLHGKEIAKRVRLHHEKNGGVSRYDKIPLYLSWVGKEPSATTVQFYCTQFSKLVMQAVIDSPWVPGARELLEKHYKKIKFVLVTATPQDEIEEILSALNISHFFCEVYGAPTKKLDAIKKILRYYNIKPGKTMMIGDSNSDYEASTASKIPFLLRRTALNHALQERIGCSMFEDYTNE
jgi:phosphoglycolate phosphatase-like HAD superfamily hydrolase